MENICICILNYNDGARTLKCIGSILDQSVSAYRVVVIDNHSSDDSVGMIRSHLNAKQISCRVIRQNTGYEEMKHDCPLVVVIQAGSNGGYSAGNNIGIVFAQSLGIFSHLLIINNDLVLERGFLSEMTAKYRSLEQEYNSEKIALGAIEYDPGGRITHHGFHYLHIPTGLSLGFRLFPSFRYIVGSCIFTGIGAPLMDESFFLYYDDIQYSKILLRENYILAVSETSRYIHEAGSATRKDPRMYRIVYRSVKRFYRLHYPYFLISAVLIRMPVNYLRNLWRYRSGPD